MRGELLGRWADALRLLNAVPHGLVASLFSADSVCRENFLEHAQAGILKFDQPTSGGETGIPFGGWKASGVGPPEHGVGNVLFTRVSRLCMGAMRSEGW